jgi:uncharacterized protein involved in response to NO
VASSVGTLPAVERASDAGTALWSRGFRPFFLLVGLYAALFLPLWQAGLAGAFPLPLWIDTFAWHGHEMLFGVVTAAIAGFLLTAVPAWTATPPVRGGWLSALAGLWVAGRAALWLAGPLPLPAVALVDGSFLPALLVVIGRPILASHQRRNLGILLAVTALAALDLASHARALGAPLDPFATLRAAAETIALLLVVIGGRITPAFTSSALRRAGDPAEVRPAPRLDALAAGATAVTALCGLVPAAWPLRAAAALVAGSAVWARLAGWQTRRTLGEPLLWSLHLGQLWLGASLLAAGVSAGTAALPASAALHALTAGAMGTTILAVAMRVSLGHTGRPLAALGGSGLALALVNAGALVRVSVPYLAPEESLLAWQVAALSWSAGFAVFSVRYGPLLWRARADGASA